MLIGGSNNLLFVTSFYRNVTEQPLFVTRQVSISSQKVESPTPGSSEQLRFVRQSIFQLNQELDALQKPIATTRSFRINTSSQPGQAVSTSDLGLTTTPATATTLESTEEINTASTSFTPFGPDFTGFGISTAQASISGVYNGDNGTGDLTFRVSQGGTHGTDDITIRVFNPDGSFYEDINISRFDLINNPYLLSNGLILTLGSGDLVTLDDFDVSVNASVPTSYSPSNPVWNGALSSAEATIGGVYDGSDGSGTFTFRVTQGGIHGQDNLSINVLKPDQTLLETISIAGTDPINNLHTLSNGLTFSLGEGDLLQDDEFTVEAFHNIGSAVDPDNPFDGTRNSDPNFQSGLSVTAGSFEVNGESIQVLGNDTINQIISKINDSNAGVTATFNSSSEIIEFTQNTAGASPTISLGNDTSGFLAATKLSSATAVAGQNAIRDEDRILSTLAQFSSVQSGTFLINSESIAIDVLSDSLNDILTRITNSAADVTAGLSGEKASITSNSVTVSVVLNSNGTGFFDALNISEGTFQATEGVEQVITRKGAPPSQAKQFGDSLIDVTNAFNNIFNDAKLNSKPSSALLNLRKDLQKTIGIELDSKGSQFKTGIGLEFDFKKRLGLTFTTLTLNSTELRNTLTSDPDTVTRTLLGTPNGAQQGLVNRIRQVLQSHESALNFQGATGLFLDVVA